jgi:hypothetical protein
MTVNWPHPAPALNNRSQAVRQHSHDRKIPQLVGAATALVDQVTPNCTPCTAPTGSRGLTARTGRCQWHPFTMTDDGKAVASAPGGEVRGRPPLTPPSGPGPTIHRAAGGLSRWFDGTAPVRGGPRRRPPGRRRWAPPAADCGRCPAASGSGGASVTESAVAGRKPVLAWLPNLAAGEAVFLPADPPRLGRVAFWTPGGERRARR